MAATKYLVRIFSFLSFIVFPLISGDLGIGRNRVLTKAGLSAQDCLFMGKHCFNSGALARSLEWFEEAWVMAGQEGNRTLRQEQVRLRIIECSFIENKSDSRCRTMFKTYSMIHFHPTNILCRLCNFQSIECFLIY